MCGIVGVISRTPVNQLIYDALLLLQHRGQDAAGIVTMQDGKCFMHKARGMVRDVFRTRNMRGLIGSVGLGQVRYPTAGNAYSEEEAQPFYVNAPFGIVLVHNGNLTNARVLRDEMVAHRPPPHQHRERHRGAAQRARPRARPRRARPAPDARHGVRRRARRAPARARLVRRRRADRRPRPARLPRSVRHPAAGRRRGRRRRGPHRRSSPASRSPSRAPATACCATWRPARRSSSTSKAASTRASAPRGRACIRACSSSSTWRGPTR